VVAETRVVAADSNARDDADLSATVLLSRDALRLLHQQRAEAAVLELARIPSVHGHCGAIHVQLPDQTRLLSSELRAEGVRGATLPQSEQADQDILLRVLVGEEGLPATVGGVVAADEFDLRWTDLVLDLVNANLAGPDIAARSAKVLHPGQREFTQVAILDAGGDERHRNVPLDTVDTGPWWHKGQDTGDEVNESVWCVVLVATGPPELVETRATDDESRVDLEPIGTEGRVFEVLAELLQVPLHSHVGEVRHHVADDLKAGIFRQLERLRDGSNRVASVRIPRDILVQTLHTDLQPSASVAEHAAQMGIQAVIWTGFDCDADTFDVAHLTRLDGLVDIIGLIPAQSIVQLRYEPFPVVLGKRHKRSAHDDVFDLVHAVAKGLDLIHPSSSLLEGIIAGSNCAHRRRLISCV